MYGGNVTLPSNSPHLRKSGSTTLVSDFGISDIVNSAEEIVNSAEENLLHVVESEEMKGVTSPLTSRAIMPSPVLLWRLKIGWGSVMRMSADLRDLFLYEAFLYYNPLLLVTMMVWFWGINLWVFIQANVNYAKKIDLDQNHLTRREIWKEITFPDFFVADILTSMSKVFSDLERSVCRMVHRQVFISSFEQILLI